MAGLLDAGPALSQTSTRDGHCTSSRPGGRPRGRPSQRGESTTEASPERLGDAPTQVVNGGGIRPGLLRSCGSAKDSYRRRRLDEDPP